MPSKALTSVAVRGVVRGSKRKVWWTLEWEGGADTERAVGSWQLASVQENRKLEKEKSSSREKQRSTLLFAERCARTPESRDAPRVGEGLPPRFK